MATPPVATNQKRESADLRGQHRDSIRSQITHSSHDRTWLNGAASSPLNMSEWAHLGSNIPASGRVRSPGPAPFLHWLAGFARLGADSGECDRAVDLPVVG